MYEVGEKRTFELANSMIFTGTIVEINGLHIRIKTIRHEDINFKISDVQFSKLLGAERNGRNDKELKT